MKLKYNELEGGIRLIKLIGALDMTGTYSIEVEFVRQCAGDNIRVLVDLSRVNYLSSIGIPMLINTAKSVVSRGGKMALLNPQQNVAEVLDIVGIQQIIPIYTDLESAKAGLDSNISSQ
ncbi:MAG: STAS domain-containing protein [Anaerolineae bacterium]|nr:STAS domain-containing protein [Anaerolineae bacterium]MCI0610331.1 STAS domain-containing protein [Anaerolineae bacterium]